MTDLSPRTWHRRASRPVSVWMGVFLLAALASPLISQPRWLLMHIFTLGILTNSVVLWSQNLTERFLQRRLDDSARPAQLTRIYLLNAGVITVIAGQLLAPVWGRHWVVTWAGAALVAAVLAWHAAALGGQVRAAGPGKRHRPAVLGYVAASFFLVVGAVLGAALAAGLPGAWQVRVLHAHLLANVGGFVGLAVMASLSVLFPAMWRVNGAGDRDRISIPLAAAGTALAVVGSFAGPRTAAAGVLVYTAAWAWMFLGFVANVVAVARDPRGRISFPGVSVFAGLIWLLASMLWYAARLFTGAPEPPSLALLMGFAAQVLIGTMSYLIPTTMGGGPAAVRAGLAELARAGWLRIIAFNAGLAGWLAADSPAAQGVFRIIAFVALVSFLPLMARAARVQVSAIKGLS